MWVDGYHAGFAGWLAMTLLWTGVLALLGYGLMRLIPGIGYGQAELAGAPAAGATALPGQAAAAGGGIPATANPAVLAATPVEILKRRLAAGEIDPAQYAELRAVIDADADPPEAA